MAAALQERLSQSGVACEADEDTFEEDFLNYRIGDVEFFFEDSLTNTTFNLPTSGRP